MGVSQQLWPGICVEREELVHKAGDRLRKYTVPVTEAVKCAFLARKRVQR